MMIHKNSKLLAVIVLLSLVCTTIPVHASTNKSNNADRTERIIYKDTMEQESVENKNYGYGCIVDQSESPILNEATDEHTHLYGEWTPTIDGNFIIFTSECIKCGVMKNERGTLQTFDPASGTTECNMYALDEWAKDYISVPESYPLAVKIQTSGNASCKVVSGEGVEITEAGLIIPKMTTYYWYTSGNFSYGTTTMNPDQEYYKVTHEIEYEPTQIQVTVGYKSYTITINLNNYADIYTDQVIDEYIDNNIDASMSVEEKMHVICSLPASYEYSTNYASARGMIISGGGDCWASTSLILKMCDKLGYEAYSRNGNRDYGAGSGHVNALVIIGDGDYYELDAGYNDAVPRYYHVYHRTSLFSYRNVTDGVEIYQYDGNLTNETALEVPKIIDSKTVVKIDDKCFSGEYVKEIILPDSIITIGEQAFAGCRYLETLHLPVSVQEVGDIAFSDCNNLVHFTCDNDNPYYTCKDGVLYNKDFTKLVAAPACSVITIPDTVQIIGTYAIYYNDNLIELVLPANVKIMEEAAIAACNNLSKVTLKGIETMDAFTFADCEDISIYFEGNPPIIDSYAFYRSVADVYYPEYNEAWNEDIRQQYYGTLTWIPYNDIVEVANGYCGTDIKWYLNSKGELIISGNGAMKNYDSSKEMPWYDYLNQIKAVVIETGVTSIGDFAFYGMPELENITIADTVTNIGSYAFKNSIKLDNVILPNGLTQLGESAFYGCTGLTAIEIPASLWTVKPYTFKNCTSLANLTLNEGNLEKISDGAFYNTALIEVTLPDCLDILDVYTFKNCSNLSSVRLGNGLTEIREASFYGSPIKKIIIPEGITKIGPYAFKNCTNLTSVELPSTLTNVGEASFYACTALENVTLPDEVTTIGNYAFRKCTGLTEVTFGEELISIGESSFYGCIGLTELVIPDKITEIQGYAFKGCTGLTSVKLGEAITTLGESAFHTCTGIKTIVIPAKVTSIGDYCFSGSWNLWQITFEGNAPAIGTNVFKGLDATAYYPGGNETWTSDVMQNYGGTITWKAK